MSVAEQLKHHRSIRSFTPRTVAESELNEILDCAVRASTGGSMQLYSMIVTTDPSRRATLAALHFGSESVRSAPVVITFCVDCRRLSRWLEVHGETTGIHNFWGFAMGFSDALLAAQNALVAAESFGLGGCFLGSTFVSAPTLARFLECPPHVVPVATLVLGHPAESPDLTTRLPRHALVHGERYSDAPAESLEDMFEVHARATFERFTSVPYVAQMVEAAGVKNLSGYFARLMYPRELIDMASAYFQAALRGQGFASDVQLARSKAVQNACESPKIAAMDPIHQFVFSMALTSGYADGVLDSPPEESEAAIRRFIVSRDATILEEFARRGLFDVALRDRLKQLLEAFGRHHSTEASEARGRS